MHPSLQNNRSIRVFVSSTFLDMKEEREALMSHTWPALRKFCREREVEFVEVDLRWGISEEQSIRNETLKLCLQEIRACRPYFVGLLGERYGWVPGPEAFTADLLEEESWLHEHRLKSVTELEILHGVLNNSDAEHALIYMRDPAYAHTYGAAHFPEDAKTADKQAALKAILRSASVSKPITLRENYASPHQLATWVLDDLKAAIDADYPEQTVPDVLTREARDHEAFAEVLRRTYIARPDYFTQLDQQAMGDGGPLVLLGESGSGKSALLANWVMHWRTTHPQDLIVQHYIGSTPDSTDHWKLIQRLIAEIKRWADDLDEIPSSHDDLYKTFPVWLAKARSKAERDHARCILVLDALNQLADQDRAKLLGWLPAHSFVGSLRLLTSTLSGETFQAVESRGWATFMMEPFTTDERVQMIVAYLARCSKRLDAPRLKRLAAAPASANPLYLKILLDELRVTGTHERLADYLSAPDIPALLKKVLTRYQRDYERDRLGVVGKALGFIWAARRGLAEAELLQLLKPVDQPQLPSAIWAPLRVAMGEMLIDSGGILNFAHDFSRIAVERFFVSDAEKGNTVRLALADYFEGQPISIRSCDELPWLLWKASALPRLRVCLLDLDRFLTIYQRSKDELMGYWVSLGEERAMATQYLSSFEQWTRKSDPEQGSISLAANRLSLFFHAAALHREAEPLARRVLAIDEKNYGPDHPEVARDLNNLALLLHAMNRLAEAEPLYRRALIIHERSYGSNHPNVAIHLNNLAELLRATNRLAEAEPLYRRSLMINEQNYGPDHHDVARDLSNLAGLLRATNRLTEAEPLYRRALAISERSYGLNHPKVALRLNNLTELLRATNRLAEAEPLYRRALMINEQNYGPGHPEVATGLSNLAELLRATNRLVEAEPLCRRALSIDEQSYGPDHPDVARDLSNLAELLRATNRLVEAEPLCRRALVINEQSYGPDHPIVATGLNNLASLLKVTNRLTEAEPLYRRALAIDEASYGLNHPDVARDLNNLALLLQATNRLAEAEPLLRWALEIAEESYEADHPHVAYYLNNLAELFQVTNRMVEAEPLLRRALAINEHSYGPDHPQVAITLNNLASLLQVSNRLTESELLMRRVVTIFLKFGKATGHAHPYFPVAVHKYAELLLAMKRSPLDIVSLLNALGQPYQVSFKIQSSA
nr:tetratricopeptide repeat protein [Nitrosomonas nitrosa]